jgi:hypothetical protein
MPKVPMQFKVEDTMFEYIKSLARSQSAEKDKDISWQDLVRSALDKAFPLAAQKKGKD